MPRLRSVRVVTSFESWDRMHLLVLRELFEAIWCKAARLLERIMRVKRTTMPVKGASAVGSGTTTRPPSLSLEKKIPTHTSLRMGDTPLVHRTAYDARDVRACPIPA